MAERANTPAPVDIRRAASGDLDTVAHVLATAFATDPMMTFMVPAERHLDRLVRLFAMEAALAAEHIQVAVDDAQIVGAAVWEPPGARRPGVLTALRTFPDLVRIFGTSLLAAGRSFRVISRAHPTRPPHWYLQTLGALHPGRGVGGALLRDGLARADAARLPVFLESSSPTNVPLYQRYGFHQIGETVLPGGGPTLVPMWRGPAPDHTDPRR